ncbi:prepilin-type N-terminal cleavage/methylation domain-containing protein [Methylobacterium sp. E-005]|uniref:prepilin-type N-terminal cleavage/methylation domain-containing protein n=1 Tax=Methylobacterium sp. E-005 TaxID=2836549 RepID=UPI001FBBB28D|nr:prepilin-type N-terminal cleavage/methylation domain-containing protein [Methylobacterium sp. E-005]MCJ2088409.1 prepilin-type N-terminal cleavage/methylation domain-containing protein [Methylobacterium sp. E-005]
MPDHGPETGRGGFALVEMLVALALAALVALLLVEAVRVAGRTATAVAAAGKADHVQSVRDHLRRTLGSLASRRLDGSRPVLRGGPDSLWAALAPDRALERPVELAISLTGAPRPDGLTDIVESRVPLETGPDRTARSEILLEGVSGLAIRYLGSPAERMPATWLTAWTRPDRRPDLVEIHIAFGPADRRRWVPLVITLGDRP